MRNGGARQDVCLPGAARATPSFAGRQTQTRPFGERRLGAPSYAQPTLSATCWANLGTGT